MKLYNTLHKKIEEFKAIDPPKVTMYSCGPTVYNYAHLGNWRSFLMADFLRRTFDFIGYQTEQVMNITDVGHLVSDDDCGEDKIEKKAREQKQTAQQISNFYLDAFLKDREKLNIQPPAELPRATEHVAEMIDLIKKLEVKGYTYKISDGIYFDTAKFPRYGKLSGQKLEEKKAGARVFCSREKRNFTDFALWKFSPKDEQRQQEWNSPWGIGFPGWHIECAVLATKYLGQPFDIHTGGVDHIGVHHENEIAECESAYDKPMANFWFHIEFLQIQNEKISKSKENFFTLEDLIQKGYHPFAFRLLIFSAHYQSKQNFSWQAVEQAQSNLKTIYQTARQVFQLAQESEAPTNGLTINFAQLQDEFKNNLENNLNTPLSLATVFNFINLLEKGISQKKISSQQAKEAYQLFLQWDQVLGLKIKQKVSQEEKIPVSIQQLSEEREKLRQEEKWEEADLIRRRVYALGYQIEDTSEGSQITPLSFF